MTLTADQFRELMVGGEVGGGALLAYLDRTWLRRPVFLALLVLTAIAGYIVTLVSPFNFVDGGYYMLGGIAVYVAVTAGAGYVVAAAALWLNAFIRGGRKP